MVAKEWEQTYFQMCLCLLCSFFLLQFMIGCGSRATIDLPSSPGDQNSFAFEPVSDFEVNEGNSLEVVLRLKKVAPKNQTVSWSIVEDGPGGKLATDHFEVAGGALALTKGSQEITLHLKTLTNDELAGNRLFRVIISVGKESPVYFKITTLANEPPPPKKVALVGGGWGTFCLLLEGSPKCWGMNGSSQVGDGLSIDVKVPKSIQLADNVSQMDSSGQTTCAVRDGEVFCWGRNDWGQATGKKPATSITAPTNILGLAAGISKVSVGFGLSCAINNGALWCWGSNDNGGRGLGHTTSVDGATKVVGMESGVVDVSISGWVYTGYQGANVCAIRNLNGNSGAYCWGKNDYGQLGVGDETNKGPALITAPAPIPSLSTGVTAIGVGHVYACAVKDNEVYCWGFNGQKNLGQLDQTNYYTPKKVSTLNGNPWPKDDFLIKELKVGTASVCVLGELRSVSENRVYCWGNNRAETLGSGLSDLYLDPLEIVNLRTANTIALGSYWVYGVGHYSSLLAVMPGDVVKGVGYNGNGQLGNGSTTSSAGFIQLFDFSTW